MISSTFLNLPQSYNLSPRVRFVASEFNAVKSLTQLSVYWLDHGRVASASSLVLHTRADERSHPWLEDALAELDEAADEAAEQGFATPSEAAVKNAERILRHLAVIASAGPAVYPNDSGGIEIAFGAPGRAVLVLCEADGGGACFSTIDGGNRRARYQRGDDMPDAFIRDQVLRVFASQR